MTHSGPFYPVALPYQLIYDIVGVLLDELQADGLQVGTNITTDLSQKVGHCLENKMRK